MISIYAPEAQDFSTLGLGALAPYECVIEEQAGGMYELKMSHPMDEAGKWINIGIGCIIKAPAPVRETPLAVEDDEGVIPTEPETVTRRIYRVRTNTGANLHLRQGPSTSTRILSKYRPGTEVVVLSQSGGWGQVIVRSSGASGYMSMQYLVFVRDEVETIDGDAPTPQRVVYPVQSRMQLFRIFKVERDAAEREVRVEARHIFYDLLGDPTDSEYAPEGVAAGTVVEQLFDRALDPHGFDVHCQLTGSVTGDYTRRGLVECLLDPDDGVVPQTGGRLIRDNFDIWLLPDMERETGVTIRHGKNLLGATLTTDWEDLTTRIIPVGQNSDGKPLLLTGTIYVDSPRIDDYPVIRAQAVEYDVKVGQGGVNKAAQARARLTELAEADFADNGVDLPTVGLDVDFVALGETEEYRQYADLEAVHLYDTVRVIAKEAGIDAAVRVTGYKWDAIGRRYESVTLGEIADLKPTVYGYELPRGSIKTIKIANGAVGSAQLRDLAVQYAHLGTAAIEQLSANSITALKAYITEIVAGSVTTDELYAGIAAISKAQLTTANIEEANIDWAQIADLQAGNIAALAAYINDLTAESIETNALYAAYAHMFSLAADNIAAGSVSADSLAAVMADIIHAEVDVGEFALAEVKNLLANALVLQAGQAGSMSIVNLVVTQANMLNATVDNLIMPGTDGKYYQIIVGSNGALSTAEVEVTEEEIAAGQTASGKQIVATTINAEAINGSTVTAQQAILNTVLTQALTAGKITAVEAMLASATVPTLYATSIKALGDSIDISANQQIQLIVGSVAQAQGTADAAQSTAEAAQTAANAAQSAADSAQEGADFATPLTGAEPPEEAPAAGKLWIDEGQTPSVWRRWRGADVPTDREYDETISGNADSPAFVAIDNTQGQLQTVALEAGCVAQQAGTGDPSPSNIRAISGRESVEVTACGKNLATTQPVIVSTQEQIAVDFGRDVHFDAIRASFQCKNLTLQAAQAASIDLRLADGTHQYRTWWDFAINGQAIQASGNPDGLAICTLNNVTFRQLVVYWMTDTYAKIGEGSEMSDFQLELGSTATAYEPYTPMGGGVITPSEPLYGLPDAKDTVEVDASGDVTVTRRTAVVELDGTESIMYGNAGASTEVQQFNAYQLAVGGVGDIYAPVVCSHLPYSTNVSSGTTLGIGLYPSSQHATVLFGMPIAALTQYGYIIGEQDTWVPAFRAYLAAQKAAGTPVTIVYELVVPETEALTAISPITPEAGLVNIWTDADALTATVRGSGWEIINDTDDLSEGIDGLLDNVGSLTGALDNTQAQLTDLAAVTITRDEVESIVTSVDGRLSSVEQQAGALDVVVAEMRGDVDNIMLGVHVGTDGVGIYRDGDPYQMNIDNRGMTVTEGGMETLSARESQVNANRMQVREALMLGSELALVVSPGKLRLQRR